MNRAGAGIARVTWATLLILVLSPGLLGAADKPNVVVMMVDNLGWGELGCYGGGILRGARLQEREKANDTQDASGGR